MDLPAAGPQIDRWIPRRSEAINQLIRQAKGSSAMQNMVCVTIHTTGYEVQVKDRVIVLRVEFSRKISRKLANFPR